MNKKILNLGAGNRIIEGADNHDIVKHRNEINLVFDLNTVFSPDKDLLPSWLGQILIQKDELYNKEHLNGYYDEIQFISVIEHLEITPIQALNECWHLLKPSGKLIIKYPHYTSYTAFQDPTHRHWLTEKSLNYTDPSTQEGKDYSYYTPYKWRILTPLEKRMIIRGGNRINVKMELEPRK